MEALLLIILRYRYHKNNETSWIEILVTTTAVIFMPLLSRARRNIARRLNSEAVMTNAKQAGFCAYQAAIVLLGLAVDAISGISWIDSVAALMMVPLLLRAGALAMHGEGCARITLIISNQVYSVQ